MNKYQNINRIFETLNVSYISSKIEISDEIKCIGMKNPTLRV